MPQLRLLLATLAVVVLTALVPSPTRAQNDDERARSHFLAGRSYMDQARYDEAAEQFAEAYALSRRPEMLINMSLAYERGLQHARAAEALERYLEIEPGSPDRTTIEARIASLRALAARSEATRSEDGTGETPAGAEGADASAPERVDEAIAPPAPAPVPAPDRPGPVGIAGIVLGGIGAAAGIAAIATGVASQSTYDRLVEGCPGDVCPPERYGDIDEGSALAIASTALTAIGATALVVGVVLLVVDLAEDDGTSRADIAIVPSAGGLLVTGRF